MLFLLLLICATLIKRFLQFNAGAAPAEYINDYVFGDLSHEVKLQELLTFNLEKLVTATNEFHPSNKLGQGGFGPVYKVLRFELIHISEKIVNCFILSLVCYRGNCTMAGKLQLKDFLEHLDKV